MTRRILITGKNGYIGKSLEIMLIRESEKYDIDMINMKDGSWRDKDFSQYDVVLHVAAVVHQREKPEMKNMYSKVNKNLTIEIAKKSKKAGVSQFIFMSTMAVYGLEGKIGQEVVINGNTPLSPKTLYATSKLEAEIELNYLNENKFKVVVLRPPMVYGPSCPGNFARLEKLAIKLPIFPMIENQRSMLHIDKLCTIIKKYIDNENEGLFFPQDDEYVNTSLMVKKLAEKNGKSIYLSKGIGTIIKIFGKKINLINKIFGNLIYEVNIDK